MASTTYGTRTATASLGHRILTRMDAASGAYGKWRLYRRTLNELQALSGRELADLGLHRSMIRGIATEAAYGK